MGGHFVQGHVDTVAEIVSVTPDGNSLVMRMRPRDGGVMKYIVEKGYVALDGASLTVTRVEDGGGGGAGGEGDKGGEGGWFEIMLVAYTQEKIVTAGKKAGEEVNVEVDMVGKYVEKNVKAYLGTEGNGRGLKGLLGKISGAA